SRSGPSGGSVYGTGSEHPTALIPTAIGIVFVVLGLLARKNNLRKHVMHAAAALALLTIIATFGGIIATARRFSGVEMTPSQAHAAFAKAATCVLTICYLGLCIRSFIQVRRARKSAEALRKQA
ncbi:MAG: hypothetical protein ABI579_04855, partial [Candidatus Sumerlaeota bacterium]